MDKAYLGSAYYKSPPKNNYGRNPDEVCSWGPVSKANIIESQRVLCDLLGTREGNKDAGVFDWMLLYLGGTIDDIRYKNIILQGKRRTYETLDST